jgi:His/Glu/Gln/Arg/opine family amino acid ABC transporter permease subunit
MHWSLPDTASLYWFGEIALAARVTIGVAVCSLVLGLVLGLAGAGALLRGRGALCAVTRAIGTAIRGVPELLTVITIYYGGQVAMNNLANYLGASPIDVDPFIAGALALGLVFGSYAMDVFAGAVLAVDRGQTEAASSLGLTRWQLFRLVVFPQSLRIALPGLSNLWLVLIKQTALIAAIALNEIMQTSANAVSVTKEPFEYFAFACFVYLVLTTASMQFQRVLQLRIDRGWKPYV